MAWASWAPHDVGITLTLLRQQAEAFKLFYDLDTPLMTPAQMLALDPPPALIIYQ